MEKRISDINRILDFLEKYGILCQKYWDVKEEDSYWEGLANDIGSLHKEYPGEFEKRLLVLLTEELSREERLRNMPQEKGQKQVGGENILPLSYEKILSEAYEMISKIEGDPMLRKVYSDVNFYRVIERIEKYREDLAVAASLF